METTLASHPLEAVLESLRRRRPVRVRLLLRDARDLLHLAESPEFLSLGFSHVADLAESLGISADEGRRLLSLARALRAWPEVEARLLDGRLNPEKASAPARLKEIDGALHLGEDWLALAEQETTLQFQRRVNRRCEETLRGEPVERVSGWVTCHGMEAFRFARRILSRRARRRITRGETIEALSHYFLDREDETRVAAGVRRVGDTSDLPGIRTIPEEVRRIVRERAHFRCEFPRCSYDTWLEYAHIVPHRLGGSREARNLLFLCGVHHRAIDCGIFEAFVEDGQAMFVSRYGFLFLGPVLLPRPPDG